eukprot:CAMPEP_0175086370 /NCGR_PEP_ID=MMETSP0052_2-20121109/29211_1 /TAXON_ID=51329 ORGANISM="Polytomella parva, Strain SAG 63-3" /NCGR_SAMPLE_ID=MMETSP0052_2 /ASSEMBLY_ACC=CAM_ASM_000194 /LENGTH=72 /DNA_ID=CAMNT_0016358545 /DNA_START=353 /DNA_END=571 /DNA_ORIENTATION=+
MPMLLGLVILAAASNAPLPLLPLPPAGKKQVLFAPRLLTCPVLRRSDGLRVWSRVIIDGIVGDDIVAVWGRY